MTEKRQEFIYGYLPIITWGKADIPNWKSIVSVRSTKKTVKKEMDCHLSLWINSALFRHFTWLHFETPL